MDSDGSGKIVTAIFANLRPTGKNIFQKLNFNQRVFKIYGLLIEKINR